MGGGLGLILDTCVMLLEISAFSGGSACWSWALRGSKAVLHSAAGTMRYGFTYPMCLTQLLGGIRDEERRGEYSVVSKCLLRL